MVLLCIQYFKLGNFRENFISTNSVKRHICYAQRLRHDLHISRDRVILLFLEGFIFTKFCIRSFSENKTLAKISELTVHVKTDEL